MGRVSKKTNKLGPLVRFFLYQKSDDNNDNEGGGWGSSFIYFSSLNSLGVKECC